MSRKKSGNKQKKVTGNAVNNSGVEKTVSEKELFKEKAELSDEIIGKSSENEKVITEVDEKTERFSKAIENKQREMKQTEERRKNFSRAIDEKKKEIAEKDKRREEFSKIVEKTGKEISEKSAKKKTRDRALNSLEIFDEELVAAMSSSERIKAVIITVILAAILVVGVCFVVINISRGNILYCIYYLIASLLALSVGVVKANSLISPFIAFNGREVTLRMYKNRLVPYDISSKAAFVCDFIPVGRKIQKMPVTEIKYIIIGTKNYIKRHCGSDAAFEKSLIELENSNISNGMMLAMDMIYFACEDGESTFMSIEKFDFSQIAEIIRECMKANKNIELMCNNKRLKSKILFALPIQKSV